MSSKHSLAFPTPLGWIAMATDGPMVCRLTLAQPSQRAALAAIDAQGADQAKSRESGGQLARRILAYLAGKTDDFRDVEVDLSYLTPLGSRVFDCCRRIPPGQTRTYGQIASEVGRPGAARAIGNFMASNRTPLLVPCHRVVGSGGRLGGFTAPGGLALKQKLLNLESGESNIYENR